MRTKNLSPITSHFSPNFMHWFDFVGSLGVFTIILTYILLQIEKVRSDSLFYSALNALGASLIIFSLYFNFNFPAFAVEFFWLLISLFGIGKYFLKKKQPAQDEQDKEGNR